MEIVSISVVEATETVTINVTEGFGSVTNSDATYNATVNVSETLVLPDITHTDTDGTPTTLPAQTPFVCAPPVTVGVDVENSDASWSVHANDGDTVVVPDCDVTNSDASVTVTVKATIDNTFPDTNIQNSDGTFNVNVPSGFPYVTPNIDFTDSTGVTTSVPANKNIIATPGFTFEAETTAFWARISGTPDISWKYDFNTLVQFLKLTGIWTKADAIYLRAFENSADSLLNIVANTNNSSLVNSPTFTKGVGFTGNASNRYINTNFNPSTDGVNYTQDDACFAQFIQNAGSAGAYNGGIYSAGIISVDIPVNNGFVTGINGNFIGSSVGTGYENLIAVSRDNNANFNFYVDGTDHTKVNASAGLPNGDIYELAVNAVPYGVPDGHVDSTVAASFIGASLTSLELQQLDTILRWWVWKVSYNP